MDIWEKLEKMKEDKTEFEVTIEGIVKGGAIAYVEGIRAFIPVSKLSLQYVEDPEEFLKKNLPYRVFMADTIYQVLSYMDRPMECVKTGDNSLAFGYMNADTKKKTAAEKLALKNTVQMLFFDLLQVRKAVSIPEEFYKISDYSTKASSDPNDDDYARKRGFVANPQYGSEWCTYVNWQTKTLLQSDDLTYFLASILCRTSTQWASDLTYPLVKEKYDILVNHFKKEYNIDLVKIGNKTY